MHGQGEDGDQARQATAVGAVAAPADSGQGPGLLQVVRWDETGEHAIIHPAFTCPVGVDRYGGLSDQDRARWAAFDAAEAWPNSVAWIPARLVERGDTIQDERGPRSRKFDMRDIEAAGPRDEGIEVKVSGVRKPRQYPADHLIGVFIPQDHPTLARVIAAATANAPATVETWLEITRGGQPAGTITPDPDAAAPDAPGGGYLAHTGHDLTAVVTDLGGGDLRITGVDGEPPIGSIVSGWEQAAQHIWGPTAHARRVPGARPAGTPASEASPPGTATVADGASLGETDGRASDAVGQAQPETGPAPQRPTGTDLAIAMRRMAQEFADVLLERQTPLAGGGYGTWRGEGEPDEGAREHITHLGDGIRIEIGTADQTRDGELTWAYIRAWLESGLTPTRRQLVTDGDRVYSQYNILANLHSVPGTPVHQALQQAVTELHGLWQQVIDAIVSDALAQHGPGPLPRRLPPRRANPAGSDGQLPLAGDQGGSQFEEAALDRVAQLASVIPPWPPRWSKPTSAIEPGDVLVHPGTGSGPFLVTAAPRRTGDTTEIDGRSNYGGHGEGPTTLRISHEKHPDPDVEIIPAAGPLTGPIPQLSPAPAEVVAEAADSAPVAGEARPTAGQRGTRPRRRPGDGARTGPGDNARSIPAVTSPGAAGQDSEAAQLAVAAGAVSRARAAAHVPIDYARMKTVNKRLRGRTDQGSQQRRPGEGHPGRAERAPGMEPSLARPGPMTGRPGSEPWTMSCHGISESCSTTWRPQTSSCPLPQTRPPSRAVSCPKRTLPRPAASRLARTPLGPSANMRPGPRPRRNLPQPQTSKSRGHRPAGRRP